jgi:hypothetical protein
MNPATQHEVVQGHVRLAVNQGIQKCMPITAREHAAGCLVEPEAFVAQFVCS